jgi:hypothetical protein
MVLVALCAFVAASVWHIHQHGMQDHCTACQLLQVTAIEPLLGLEVDPLMAVWHIVPGISYSPQINQIIDNGSSRAPPPSFLLV